MKKGDLYTDQYPGFYADYSYNLVTHEFHKKLKYMEIFNNYKEYNNFILKKHVSEYMDLYTDIFRELEGKRK